MGNINSYNPFTDHQKPRQFPNQHAVAEKRSSLIRYLTIQLDQGEYGKNIPSIVNKCVREIRTQKASIEYIEAVFDHIHNKVQEGKVDEIKGGRATLAILWATRWPYMATINGKKMNSEQRIALEIIRADALSRLSLRARRGWRRRARRDRRDGYMFWED